MGKQPTMILFGIDRWEDLMRYHDKEKDHSRANESSLEGQSPKVNYQPDYNTQPICAQDSDEETMSVEEIKECLFIEFSERTLQMIDEPYNGPEKEEQIRRNIALLMMALEAKK